MDRQLSKQPTLGKQHRCLCIGQHESQPLSRVARIERHVGSTGLENPQQPHQQIERTLHRDRYQYLPPHPECAQVVRELIGPRIELGISELFSLEHHRGGLRCALHLGLAWFRMGFSRRSP